MNSFERVHSAVKFQKTDCIPVGPYMGNFGATIAGIPIDKYCQSGSLMAKGQFDACQIIDQNIMVLQSDNYYIAEGFGLQVEHHPGEIPTSKGPLLEEIHDCHKLNIPDPRKDGRMPVILEAVDILVTKVKGKKIIRVPGSGPFTLASLLVGIQKFLIECAIIDKTGDEDREKALRDLIEICTEAVICFQKAAIDAGADIIQVGDSLASTDMISPATYEKWAFPYQKRSFDAVKHYCESQNQDCITILHICGNTTPILELEAQTGADLIELDAKVDMRVAKEKLGGRAAIIGNLDPSGVLLAGTPEFIEKRSLELIDEVGPGSGFILGSGCEVPPKTPVENILAMVRAARKTQIATSG